MVDELMPKCRQFHMMKKEDLINFIFIHKIQNGLISLNFRLSNFYGDVDLTEYVMIFYARITLYDMLDALMYCVFLMTTSSDTTQEYYPPSNLTNKW